MKKYLYRDLFIVEDTHWWHISKRRVVKKFIEEYTASNKLKILDIGCGTGRNIEQLQNLGNIYGLDNSNEALKFCRKRGLKNLILGSAEKTNLADNSFDIITLLDVLEHTDDKKTLKEAGRILKRNGLLIITVPAYNRLWSQWDIVLHHKRRYTTKSLARIINANNFQILKISYMYSFLILPVILIRLFKSLLFRKDYPSDFKLTSKPVNYLLDQLSSFESNLILNGFIPFGTSIIAVAKKINE